MEGVRCGSFMGILVGVVLCVVGFEFGLFFVGV